LLNAIFIGLITISVVFAAFNGRMSEVMDASIAGASTAVEIAIGLLGMMALWLGLMRVLRDAGFMAAFARAVSPVMRRLFPDVPTDHPAMSAMIMNIAANMLGLTNAATPFGLKAMQELKRLNQRPGVASNSMALFLAINTSGVAVLPLGAIAVRASVGSNDPAGILVPTLLATACSTVVAVMVAMLLQGRSQFALDRYPPATEEASSAGFGGGLIKGMAEAEETASISTESSPVGRVGLVLFFVLMIAAIANLVLTAGPDFNAWDFTRGILGSWLLPVLMVAIVLFGFSRRINVYDSVISGAREGFNIMVLIIPYLVAILVAVGMFRASGALELVAGGLASLTSVPAEGFVMALVRPLSGSGALGVMTEAMSANGPDSFVGYLVSVMSGSTETTFYVIALYFGSVSIRAGRHTVFACLAADFTGFLAALFWCWIFFG
jgi:spore maturation protein SpmA